MTPFAAKLKLDSGKEETIVVVAYTSGAVLVIRANGDLDELAGHEVNTGVTGFNVNAKMNVIPAGMIGGNGGR